MENSQTHSTAPRKWKMKVNAKFLILGIVFTGATVLMMIFLSQFFWIGLPFAFTFLAQSIDAL